MGESFQCKSPGVRAGGMVMAKIDNCITKLCNECFERFTEDSEGNFDFV